MTNTNVFIPSFRRRLSIRYCLLHGLYWSAYCCVFGFAAASLLSKGFHTSIIGTGLAIAMLLSGLLQPLAASLADRFPDKGLKRLLLSLAWPSALCFLILWRLPLPPVGYLSVYVLGALLLDMLHPLLNALCGYYSDRSFPLYYGPARGVGSIFYAAVSLCLGMLMEHCGSKIPLLFSVAFLSGFLLVSARMPLVSHSSKSSGSKAHERAGSNNLRQFLRCYPRFCASLLGILSMQAGLIMLETYLISILERVGGGTGDLGITLAIATCSEIPILLFYPRFRHIIPISSWMKLSGLSTLLKALAFFFAFNVPCIMLAQLLQITSYAIYAACVVDYARERIPAKDAVKGQAMVTSACTLGSSLGNWLGGHLIHRSGVGALLLGAVMLSSVSAAVFFLTIRAPSRTSQ